MGDDCCGPGHDHAGHRHGAAGAPGGPEGHDGHDHGAHGHAPDGADGGQGDGDYLEPTEAAALRGFLSGIYATRLDADELQAYLDSMGEDHSAFGRPARFLAEQMRALTAAVELPDDEPPAWQLLQAVSQEADEETTGEEE